ncbi:HDOD domain-containing protein [Aminomonas paucivorans]|uniref:Metal dependent phosphohydrolase n=1 Tax=Aminomonas paucivorans DSM 12260 TaxID=584708 RepID=E3CYA2_9BACT|nr:metal dependent phosphohydrolase [Aminomonas paucivorans DSM 12260]
MQGLDERTRDLIQRRVLKRVNDIPSLPQFVIDTLKKLDDPKSSAQDVADKLSRDEGLVLRILRLANSAYYGLPRRITGVSEAISLLGFKTVKSIVLAASVYKFMDGSFTGYALDRGELWKHSLSVAFASRYLAKKIKGLDDEEAYVAGMVHDIGKIVLNDYVRFGYGIIAKLVEDDQVPFMDAERQVLGFDHAQVGGLIMEQWNLPETYMLAARYHHSPWELPEESKAHQVFVDVIHVANILCLMLGVGLGADGLQYKIHPESLERLGIADVEVLMSDLVDLMAKVDEEMVLEDAG